MDTVLEQALALLEAIHAKSAVLDADSDELYLAQDLTRFIRNRTDRERRGLSELFERSH